MEEKVIKRKQYISILNDFIYGIGSPFEVTPKLREQGYECLECDFYDLNYFLGKTRQEFEVFNREENQKYRTFQSLRNLKVVDGEVVEKLQEELLKVESEKRLDILRNQVKELSEYFVLNNKGKQLLNIK